MLLFAHHAGAFFAAFQLTLDAAYGLNDIEKAVLT